MVKRKKRECWICRWLCRRFCKPRAVRIAIVPAAEFDRNAGLGLIAWGGGVVLMEWIMDQVVGTKLLFRIAAYDKNDVEVAVPAQPIVTVDNPALGSVTQPAADGSGASLDAGSVVGTTGNIQATSGDLVAPNFPVALVAVPANPAVRIAVVPVTP